MNLCVFYLYLRSGFILVDLVLCLVTEKIWWENDYETGVKFESLMGFFCLG